MKKRLLSLILVLILGLLPMTVLAIVPNNYKANITQVSVGSPTRMNGGKYLPIHVHFSAAENLGNSNDVEFLEGYLRVLLSNGTTAQGITELGMTLIGPLKPDALDGAGSNHFSWAWNEGKGTGVVQYNIPLLGDGETQTVEKSQARGQTVVNGLKVNDKVTLQLETVLLNGGSLMSDEFTFTIEDSSKYPKTITKSGGEDKCTHSKTSWSDKDGNCVEVCQQCGEILNTKAHNYERKNGVLVCSRCGTVKTEPVTPTVTSGPENVPKTGDKANPVLWLGLLISVSFALFCLNKKGER